MQSFPWHRLNLKLGDRKALGGRGEVKMSRISIMMLTETVYQFSLAVLTSHPQCSAFSSVQFSSVTQSCPTLWDPMDRSMPGCPSPTPGVYSNVCSLSWWCHPTISSSVVPFSSCLQSFPASGPFLMSQLFASGDQSIGVSASTSVFPMNTQDWSPLGWTGWIFLQSKDLSIVFFNTTVQKHQFFGAQLSL